jgi:pimeloyl-ACP methyl ester carboxylesterase
MTRNLYALLVGINNYDNRSRIPSLSGCVNDIQGMQAYLEGRVAGREFTLHLRVLTNEQATRANIIEGFRAHLCQAGPEDVALFYYAGHGAQADAPEEFWSLEPDRMLETLVCYNSRIDDEHWDLADKELAKLIAEVDGKKPHITVVLDCCHSGSGTRGELTRRAAPDKRPRPLKSFIVSPTDAAQTAAQTVANTRSLSPTAMKLPVGRHVVLSACRDIEEASEYNGAGQRRGAFSYFFQESLTKANGSLSYRDLFKRTNALVRLNIPAQAPQMEATHSEDLEQLFLGGAIAPTLPYFTASHHREHGWCIDGGAIHGLQPPTKAETTLLALFPFDSSPEQIKQVSGAIAQVKITQVLPQLSKIESNHPALADTTNTFKAVVMSSPLPSFSVVLEGVLEADKAGVEALREAIATAGPNAQPSLYVRAVEQVTEQANEQASGASYRVLAKDNTYTITSASDHRPLVTPVQGYTPASIATIVQNLEHMARGKTIAELNSPANSQIQGAVKVSIYTGEGTSHESATEITDPQIRLTYTLDNATQSWSPPRFRVKLHNTSNTTLYCALFYLTERFKAEVLKPDGIGGVVRLLPNDELWFAGGRALSGTVSDALWQQGITECQDILKLIACTDEFDPTLMTLGELGSPVRSATRSATRSARAGSLNKLMQRVTTREMSFADDTPSYDDWVASQIAFTFVRPQLSTAISRSAPVAVAAGANTALSIAPHTELQANARLTTVSQSTRDLGSFVVPPLFKETEQEAEQENEFTPHSEPFQFTQSRSSDPGLSSLELSNVSHFEAVTAEQPLIIETDIPLGENEYLLPIAYDGEFYLPLGYGKPKNGKTHIVIERLTEPISEGRRSIQGSIRIFFQKVITQKLGEDFSKKIGVTFEYPLLAAAEVTNPASAKTREAKSKVVYIRDIEAVKAKVAQAHNIALYVHGIFGDTESMLPSLETAMAAIEDESQPIGQLYDLVLAFDYENINTTIDQNARLLKQRLTEVGLGPNHGKTLHIIAHSMGGLVSRWLIEQEGGNTLVSHLIMLGTPNAGSPWPQVQAGVTAALAFALNGLSVVAAPLTLLEGLLKRAETIDVSLDQMQPGSDFLTEMAKAKDPGIPYTLVIGNTSLVPEDKAAGLKKRILHKLGKVVEIPFFNQPNDIAVLVESITALPAARSPLPKQLPTACNHLEYFVHPAGLASLSAAVVGTGITATKPMAIRAKLLEPVGVAAGIAAGVEADVAADAKSIEEAPAATPAAVVQGSGANPWIVGLVALALAGLGLYVWSAIADTTPPPPATESEVSNLKI